MTDVMTKQQLLDALRSSGETVSSTVANVSEETLAQGRYEEGWNGRQILAHIASIEWTYPRLLDMAKGAAAMPPTTAPPPQPAAPAGSGAAPAGTPSILSYNDRQVAKREAASVVDLIDEFKKNRAATIAAIESADEALLSKEITSAGGLNGPLANVYHLLAVQHVLNHLSDITGEKK
jgi:DinB family protein